ncbi:hypothetical protein, partial [Flavobacterium sp.]|uniref:hypothetical protein n=1 Tax=Flavobacterium sp. TaxID=239 RepID=UPI002617BD29
VASSTHYSPEPEPARGNIVSIEKKHCETLCSNIKLLTPKLLNLIPNTHFFSRHPKKRRQAPTGNHFPKKAKRMRTKLFP